MTSYDIIKRLCGEEGMSISALEKEMSYSNGSLSKAKKIPAERILELSKRFNVSMEYLMTGQPDEPQAEPSNEIITVAAHLDGDEYTEEELDKIKAFADFVKSQRK